MGPSKGWLRALLAEVPYVKAVDPPTLPELKAEMAGVDLAYRNDKGRVALARVPGAHAPDVRGVARRHQ
ncbi:hypothetical protein [Nocardia sp. NBC_01009]|uniref:hypothetical protein n=1 Tax=Nocardia sp. NBC_01009 TaxID=2975996 RepID=UPI00386BF991|nr:hypothetical protein OHA42_20970 [Nocardia sp. NBC_01009]